MGKQNKLSRKEREARRLMYETPAYRPAVRRVAGSPMVLETHPERDNPLVRFERRYQRAHQKPFAPAARSPKPIAADGQPTKNFKNLQRRSEHRTAQMQAELS